MRDRTAIVSAVIVAFGLLGVAAFNRYELGGAPGVVRLDKLTGEVVPCTKREKREPDKPPEFTIECAAPLRAW